MHQSNAKTPDSSVFFNVAYAFIRGLLPIQPTAASPIRIKSNGSSTGEAKVKKGTNWKRVFVHSERSLLKKAEQVLNSSGIETYSRAAPANHGKPQLRTHETHMFVPRGSTKLANVALVDAGLIFESGVGA